MSKRAKSSSRKFDYAWEMAADANLSSGAKLAGLTLLLKRRNNKTGLCNPGFSTIAEDIGLCRRAAINAVHELEAKGWIQKESTHGGSPKNTTKITFHRPATDGEPVKQTSPEGVKQTSRVKKKTEGVKQTAHEPSKTTSLREEEGEGASRRAPFGAPCSSLEGFEEFWRQYPWRVDEQSARQQFADIIERGEATAAELTTGAMRYAADREGEDPQYTARPANWLKKQRWKGEPRPKANDAARPQRAHGRKPSLANIALRDVGINVPEDWQR